MEFTVENVLVAQDVISSKVKITPVYHSAKISWEASKQHPFRSKSVVAPGSRLELFFKCENLQETGSFKLRGAIHTVARMTDEELKRGVVAGSSGNHAKALAKVVRDASEEKGFPIPAYIIMTGDAQQSKVTAVKSLGAQIFRSGSSSAERDIMTELIRKRTKAILIPSANHIDIILGQGTLGVEFLNQVRQIDSNGLDILVAPCGGGGLLAGLGIALFGSRVKVFGAEPWEGGADETARGLQEGKRIEHVASRTIADGLRTPVGALNWEIISNRNYVEGIYTVSDQEIKQAMTYFIAETEMVIEPSAAVPLAVVLFNDQFRDYVFGGGGNQNIGIVLSGGNIDPSRLKEIQSEFVAAHL